MVDMSNLVLVIMKTLDNWIVTYVGKMQSLGLTTSVFISLSFMYNTYVKLLGKPKSMKCKCKCSVNVIF